MKDKFGLKTSFGLAGAGIGMGIAGEAFSSEGLKYKRIVNFNIRDNSLKNSR